jgi:hypothetical protein
MVTTAFCRALKMALHVASFRDFCWDLCRVFSWVLVTEIIIKS